MLPSSIMLNGEGVGIVETTAVACNSKSSDKQPVPECSCKLSNSRSGLLQLTATAARHVSDLTTSPAPSNDNNNQNLGGTQTGTGNKTAQEALDCAASISTAATPDAEPTASEPALAKVPASTNSTGSAASAVGKPSSSSSSYKAGSMCATAAAASTALAAAKLGLSEQLSSALAIAPAAASMKDVEGRCCLHYAAGYGHEECVDVLLAKGGSEVVKVRDKHGDLPLHLAAQQGHPMCAYNIAKVCPASCLFKNKRSQSPIDVAAAGGRGEVLNALLLACAGEGQSTVAVAAMRALLAAGAVPDTWAPNGSSALMLAAAADGVTALQVLLEGGATIELQDALGRSALMFAAGNGATAACQVLLDKNASLSARDRRGRAAFDYAPAGSEAATLLQQRLTELETVANKLQQQLLQEGQQSKSKPASSNSSAASIRTPCGGSGSNAAAKGNGKKKKKKKAGKPAAAAAGATEQQAGNKKDEHPPGRTAGTAAAEPASVCQNDPVDRSTVDAAADQQAVEPTEQAPGAAGEMTLAAGPSLQSVRDPTAGAATGEQQEALSTYVELLAATIAAERSAAVEASAVAVSQEEDWQVVVPKCKQRTAPGSSNSSHCGDGCNGAVAAARTTVKPSVSRQIDSTAKQQHKPADGPGKGSSSSSHANGQQQQHPAASQEQAVVKQQAVSGCNTLRVVHRRQGSSHSLCSTDSTASYDSCCSSTTGLSAALATTPKGGASSCCSCISCCSHHSLPLQRLQAKASGVSSSCVSTPTAAVAVGSGAQNEQLVVAGRASMHLKAHPTHSYECCTLTTAAPTTAAGFKAALLGLNSGNSSREGAWHQACELHINQGYTAEGQHMPVLKVQTEANQEQRSQAAQQQQQQLQEQLQQAHEQVDSLKQEVAGLKAQLLQQARAHQQQLAAVLEDAATHEAVAVKAAAEAAVTETLHSPLVRQLLAVAAQQAVATERARMQLLLQAAAAATGPAAAVLATSAAAAVAAEAGAIQPPSAALAAGSAGEAGMKSSSMHSQASAASVEGMQRGQAEFDSWMAPQLPGLKLDLRSEYYGGSSSFVAPAKHHQQCQTTCSVAAEAASRQGELPSSPGNLAANPDPTVACDALVISSNSAATDPVPTADSVWRRISTDSLFAGNDTSAPTGCTTRSSSSDSLAMSIADDAQVEERHIGSFGAIGAPPTTPPSSYSHSRALSCSPAVTSLWATGGLVSGVAGLSGTVGCSVGTSLGTSPLWSLDCTVDSLGKDWTAAPVDADRSKSQGTSLGGCKSAAGGAAQARGTSKMVIDVVNLLPDQL